MREARVVINATMRDHVCDQRESKCCGDAILTALSSAGIDCEGWRTIESAPKDGTWVLIYDPSFEGEMAVSIGSYMTADERDKKGRFKCGEWCLFEWDGLPSHATPTHWRPLPLPPLASGGG